MRAATNLPWGNAQGSQAGAALVPWVHTGAGCSPIPWEADSAMQAAMPTSGCVCCCSLCDFHGLFESEPGISIVGGRGGGEEGEEGSVKEKRGFFLSFFLQLTIFSVVKTTDCLFLGFF